ncbi:hypothetical protein MSG28_015301 [Choristoneura fumiferana]|uniref:Uncharacterized protein n=1 Tax=Choristoneura fumiferana TaxID=7141 RepID=A0ACC0KAD1_CHOFU|nr:hypothetical protein MSG28_015301 [Choristoneura fumiferana]
MARNLHLTDPSQKVGLCNMQLHTAALPLPSPSACAATCGCMCSCSSARSTNSTGTDSFTDLGLHDKKICTGNDSFTDHGFHDKHIKVEGFIWGVATKVACMLLTTLFTSKCDEKKQKQKGCCSVIIPEELPSLLSVAYSNIPPIKKARASRQEWTYSRLPHLLRTIILGFDHSCWLVLRNRLQTGTDSRVGFGFAFGNHADFQVMFELGPQTNTAPLSESIGMGMGHKQLHNRDQKRRVAWVDDDIVRVAGRWMQVASCRSLWRSKGEAFVQRWTSSG